MLHYEPERNYTVTVLWPITLKMHKIFTNRTTVTLQVFLRHQQCCARWYYNCTRTKTIHSVCNLTDTKPSANNCNITSKLKLCKWPPVCHAMLWVTANYNIHASVKHLKINWMPHDRQNKFHTNGRWYNGLC